MKSFPISIGWLIASFVWTLFMGVTVGSIAGGAIYPPINYLAKPFVCPNGVMTYNESTSNPLPGTTYTQIGWYCVDARAEKTTELDIFQIALPAGLIIGFVAYVVGLATFLLIRLRQPAGPAAAAQLARRASGSYNAQHNSPPAHASPTQSQTEARLHELKVLRSKDLISEAEYQQKRADILKDL
jgi:hypothetical protein